MKRSENIDIILVSLALFLALMVTIGTCIFLEKCQASLVSSLLFFFYGLIVAIGIGIPLIKDIPQYEQFPILMIGLFYVVAVALALGIMEIVRRRRERNDAIDREQQESTNVVYRDDRYNNRRREPEEEEYSNDVSGGNGTYDDDDEEFDEDDYRANGDRDTNKRTRLIAITSFQGHIPQSYSVQSEFAGIKWTEDRRFL
eukprot:CAMPEP_0172475838 /NCGR_PEP_ID=MMETSP1065-20121228/70075_1 /TAXON_ID=265537 /ORGANISM="Amphiprora paludosa, Strain CCMP125" /LENGTH=199 /DNA_ID=CAMNT_0013234053 /DNA_START=142 /DNA_END=742 /DNA_ORIENTATION=+